MFKKKEKKEKKKEEKSPSPSTPPQRLQPPSFKSAENPRTRESSIGQFPPPIPVARVPSQVIENVNTQPLEEEDERDEEGLVFSEDKQGGTVPVIKGGNIVKLVERLTYWKYNDNKYVKAFMLTFRSFTTPHELLDLLIQRYNIEPPPGSSEDEITQFNEKQLKVVRLRVFNIIRDWLTNGFYDFEEDQSLFNKLLAFSKTLSPNWSSQLDKIITKKKSEKDLTFAVIFGDQKPPPPHLPRQNINSKEKGYNILTFHPEELARQLTLIEMQLYGKIKPQECLNQNWMHKTLKNELAPNILRMIGRFNEVSTWVASEIVKTVDINVRAKVLKHIIEIAEFCLSLNNFNGVMEIISGLNSSSIFRLKQTWAMLPKSHQKSLDEMNSLMARGSTNYKNFRAYLHNVNPPCIPYLGVYLTDLTFIEEGNKDNLPDGNINFMKRQRLAEVIAEIQTYQNTPYCLEVVAFIRDYLLNAESLPEEQCYKLSQKREGKEGVNTEMDDGSDEPFGEMERRSDYPFDHPDTESTITFERNADENSSQIVISGTPVKLIERLTHRSFQDIGFLNAFLMNLHKITTPQELLNYLEIRADMPKPKNPSKQQLQTFITTRVLPVHLRIFNVLKSWVNNYFEDFSSELLVRAKSFLDSLSENGKSHAATVEGIRKIIDKKESEGIPIYRNKIIGSESPKEPSQITSLSPNDLAQQITLVDQKIFQNIRSRELLCEEWQPINMASVAPNILSLRNNFDAMKRWVCTEIISQPTAESRFRAVVIFTITAEKLLALRNFQSTAAIMAGFRLIKEDLEKSGIWEWMPAEALEKFNQLEITTRTTSRIKALEKAEDTKRTIPYIENTISQLNQINMVLTDYTNKLINFEKLRKLYEIFEVWNRYQSDGYPYKPSATLQYLMRASVLSNNDIKRISASMERVSPNEPKPDISDLLRVRTESISELENDTSDPSSSELTNSNLDIHDSNVDTNSLDYSPPTSPRTERDDIDPDTVRAQMVSIFNEDKEFLKEIIEFAKNDLAHDLLSELRKYTDCVRDEIALSHSLMGVNSSSDASCGRILLRLFPEENIDQIVEYDAEGFVYGWAEEVYLYRVQSEERCMLTHLLPHVGKSDLASTFRLFQLFHKREETDKEIKYVIITPSITEDARTLAESKGVILMDFYKE